ncbi:hypothetical protein M441DRAFT_151272, partial [Trichoderma asperellum CBS 433.97]
FTQYIPSPKPRRRMQGVNDVGTFVLPAVGQIGHDGFRSVFTRLMASGASMPP